MEKTTDQALALEYVCLHTMAEPREKRGKLREETRDRNQKTTKSV